MNDWRKTQYIDHVNKYDALSIAIGVEKLKRLVPVTKQELVDAYETDPYLNNIELSKWDKQHMKVWCVRTAVDTGAKIYGWSVSDSVCLLKHIARYYIIEDTIEGGYLWQTYERDEYMQGRRATRTQCLESSSIRNG